MWIGIDRGCQLPGVIAKPGEVHQVGESLARMLIGSCKAHEVKQPRKRAQTEPKTQGEDDNGG